ncbi:hypothetical protein LSH36_141g10087 [Paralvinella palmiformis]|uniref:C-type lectin domain-containing protein n=1 Tax=Paralvinella palmiformis TaxID=53620 RepID=A0AAD9JV87_9ANNE|nr:hypothetical protein LSH36_141g10087 [Paralvinella palmiformis]
MGLSVKTVDTVIKNSHSNVLGEMDQGDKPWLAKVELEFSQGDVLNKGRIILGRLWLSAKKRFWIHESLDLALTYDHGLMVNHHDGSHCVVMVTTEQFEARQCSENHLIICMNNDLVSCKGCIYDGRCYFTPGADAAKKGVYNVSVSTCRRQSASLVAIFDKYQMQWLTEVFSQWHRLLIIFVNNICSPLFWTGYKYETENTNYYWYDGSLVINGNWTRGQNTTGDCVVINENGEWEKSNCLENESFVCQQEVPYGKVANTTCMIYLDEYICYWPGATKKNFHQAMAQCLSEGGTLSNRSPSSSPDKPNIFFDNFWIGISDGQTPGVLRGIGNLKLEEVYLRFPQPIGTDYWNVEDIQMASIETSDLIIRNVENLNICWDMCVTYIGYECLVVSYDANNKECRLSDRNPDRVIKGNLLSVSDPSSYCLQKVEHVGTIDEAIECCNNYKSGWELPVILDHSMLEKLGNLIDPGERAWISATNNGSKLGAFKTFDDEYIPYSNWAPNENYTGQSSCVTVDQDYYWRTELCSSRSRAICFSNLSKCGAV